MPVTRQPSASRVLPTVDQLKPAVLQITRKFGITNVRIFGSFARGEQRRSSDVDLLVDLPDGMTIFDLVALKQDLERKLRRTVDIVPARSLKPALRTSILADARQL